MEIISSSYPYQPFIFDFPSHFLYISNSEILKIAGLEILIKKTIHTGNESFTDLSLSLSLSCYVNMNTEHSFLC